MQKCSTHRLLPKLDRRHCRKTMPSMHPLLLRTGSVQIPVHTIRNRKSRPLRRAWNPVCVGMPHAENSRLPSKAAWIFHINGCTAAPFIFANPHYKLRNKKRQIRNGTHQFSVEKAKEFSFLSRLCRKAQKKRLIFFSFYDTIYIMAT